MQASEVATTEFVGEKTEKRGTKMNRITRPMLSVGEAMRQALYYTTCSKIPSPFSNAPIYVVNWQY